MTTIHDVARRAGVSPVTVSRVINGANNVNAATREKVERVIKELGYLPNLAARSLRSGQTFTLALILPDITNAFWTTVARGVEDAAQSEGYLVWLCNSDESLEKQNGYINAVLQQRVDGVILAPYNADPANLSRLRELNTPVVTVDRVVKGWDGDSVRCDSVSAAYALVRHLIDLGHRTIAIVSGPSVTSTAEERVAGYCLALEDAGIAVDPRLIRRGEYRARSGRQQTDQMLEEGLSPTAIVAANNVVAMGVLESLYDHGKMVPQDIALVCFDELPDLARFYPFLTVAVQPAYDMGMNAAQLLLSRINAAAPLQPRRVVLPCRLILRHSCGRFLNQPDGEMYPPPLEDNSQTILVKRLSEIDVKRVQRHAPGFTAAAHPHQPAGFAANSQEPGRLQRALHHQSVDRLPHIETHLANKALLEYVLERSLPYHAEALSQGSQVVAAADWVEFAQRMGIDAVPCKINWLPDFIQQGRPEDLLRERRSFPSPSLSEHFTRLEGFLRAAQAGSVGVFAVFPSFFSASLNILRLPEPQLAWTERRDELKRWMDVLAAFQQKVVRAVCDRFSTSLVFAAVHEPLIDSARMGAAQADLWQAVSRHLQEIIQPAKEHGLVVAAETDGAFEPYTASLIEGGFGLLMSINPKKNDLRTIADRWQGQTALSVGFPAHRLASTDLQEVEAYAADLDHALALPHTQRAGILFGVSPALSADVRPESYLAMVRALRRLGNLARVD